MKTFKEEELRSLEKVSATKAARFRLFLESHPETAVEINGKRIPYRSGSWDGRGLGQEQRRAAAGGIPKEVK